MQKIGDHSGEWSPLFNLVSPLEEAYETLSYFYRNKRLSRELLVW